MNTTFYTPQNSIQLSELEIANITNFIVKESFEIIHEELEYLFMNRDTRIRPVVQEILMNKNLDLKTLRLKLNKFLLTPEEISLLVQKIEYRIKKEIRMAQWNCDFTFDHGEISWLEPGCIVNMLQEEGKTLSYSTAMSKVIDTAWSNLSRQIIPKNISSLGKGIHLGDIVLGAVKADTNSLKNDLETKIYKLIKGYIKQYKNQLYCDLTSQVRSQLFPAETYEFKQEIRVKIQTA